MLLQAFAELFKDIERLREKLGDKLLGVTEFRGETTAHVELEVLHDALKGYAPPELRIWAGSGLPEQVTDLGFARPRADAHRDEPGADAQGSSREQHRGPRLAGRPGDKRHAMVSSN